MSEASDWSTIGLARWMMSLVAALSAHAARRRAREMSEINVAQQYGISYLPLMIMEDQKLIEKHAKAAGVDVKVGLGEVRRRQRDERRAAVGQPAVRLRRRGPVRHAVGARRGATST